MVFHLTPGDTLNHRPAPAAEEPADRTLRHLRMCREMAELGMDMARSAHAARDEWPEPDPIPEPAPEPAPKNRATRPRARAHAPCRYTISPSLAFPRIIRAVQQVMALEIRIAADQAAKAERAATQAATHAWRLAEEAARNTPPEPRNRPEPPHRTPPSRNTNREIPSLLATISQEIGIDLEDPTLSTRLPGFLQTGPP